MCIISFICFIDRFLHLAIIFGEDDFATQTIQMAKCKESLSIHNNLQQSPIHLAVLTNKPRLVQLLLARGAVVDARDRHGNTPLHMACRCVGNSGCCRITIRARLNVIINTTLVN